MCACASIHVFGNTRSVRQDMNQKNPGRVTGGFFVSTYSGELVDHLCILALLVGSGILMNETAGGSFVQLLDSSGVSRGGSSLGHRR